MLGCLGRDRARRGGAGEGPGVGWAGFVFGRGSCVGGAGGRGLGDAQGRAPGARGVPRPWDAGSVPRSAQRRRRAGEGTGGPLDRPSARLQLKAPRPARHSFAFPAAPRAGTDPDPHSTQGLTFLR